jgi:hypothetical protein
MEYAEKIFAENFKTEKILGVCNCFAQFTAYSIIRCVRGLDLAYKYCDDHQVPYKKVGKLIVATDSVEVDRLKVSVF